MSQFVAFYNLIGLALFNWAKMAIVIFAIPIAPVILLAVLS